jgi:hypothetical protein
MFDAIPKEYAAALATLASALIGFTGVICTLAVNGWLTRRTERRKEDHDRRVLRVGLLSELRNLIRIMKEELDYIGNPEHDFTWVPLIDFFNVYAKNLDKLGLLSTSEVEDLTRAYYSYIENAGYIARFADVDMSKPILGTYVPFKLDAAPDARGIGSRAGTRHA